MSRYVSNPHSFLMCMTLACTAALALAACNRNPVPSASITEMQWARIALERNPGIEVVATDAQAQVFTIRNKATGDVQAVKLSELAATPAAYLSAPASTADTTSTPAESTPATPVAEPAQSQVADTAAQTEAPATTAQADTPAQSIEPQNYTIERSAGQVKVSGPGVSIVTSGTQANAGAAGEPGQRKVDPIICEGQRMVQLDNRTIYVDGDAVTARGGCELYITNSRIIASGTGVIVRDAVVHIYNSYIEGSAGSFEADGGAKLYVRGSTFHGLSRRDSLASVQDQGGNQWR